MLKFSSIIFCFFPSSVLVHVFCFDCRLGFALTQRLLPVCYGHPNDFILFSDCLFFSFVLILRLLCCVYIIFVFIRFVLVFLFSLFVCQKFIFLSVGCLSSISRFSCVDMDNYFLENKFKSCQNCPTTTKQPVMHITNVYRSVLSIILCAFRCFSFETKKKLFTSPSDYDCSVHKKKKSSCSII